MGDIFLSAAEIDAISLNRDAIRPEFFSFLPAWAAADRSPPPESDRPQPETAAPEADILQALLEILPQELFDVRGIPSTEEGNGGDSPPQPDLAVEPRRGIEDLPTFMEMLQPQQLLPFHHSLTRWEEEEEEDEPPPGPRLPLERLEKVVVEAAEQGDDAACCPICLEDLEVGSEARAMGCSHRYHGGCILEWLRRKTSCPLCRYQMPVG